MRKVYRISKCRYIDDLKGTGAAKYSGRWHSKGTYILYTAATPSLALLESVVHLAGIPMESYCMICLEIPEGNILTITNKELPETWYINPPPGSLTAIGDHFIQKNQFLALQLPSAIMPEDNNVLINPNHKDFGKVKIVYKRTIPIDKRLL
ncbi:MAG: RES family NAD+ phosphorylase [Chitinophagaceae bacterium]|nr:RES family NAD+ phosphorylase [Chitinophagaceae bacterium]